MFRHRSPRPARAGAVVGTVVATVAVLLGAGSVGARATPTLTPTAGAPTTNALSASASAASASAAASSAAARSAAAKAYVARAGRSPSVPNPDPPLGGLAPDGQAVGGAALRSRGLILPAGAAALPKQLTAQAWMVTDLDTGAVLAARDPHGRYQPASVLKLLAGLVLLPHLPGNRVITATAQASNAEGSAVGLVAGGKYTVDTLFRSLYLMSGNDAAMALAVANGGPARTVAQMNAEARRLGAYDTVVQTPSGLDGWTQLTSAYDLSLVLRAAVNTPRLLAYDEARTAKLPAQKVGKRKWGAVPLFNESANFLNTVPGALLAKTGYTGAARHTYVCAADRGGRRIGVVFLRNERRPLDQYQQAGALLNWAFALPRTTPAVGQLVGAAQSSGPSTSNSPGPSASGSSASTVPGASGSSATGPSATPNRARSTRLAAATTDGRRHGEFWTWGPVWVTVVVLAALTVVLRAYGRRRRHIRRYR